MSGTIRRPGRPAPSWMAERRPPRRFLRLRNVLTIGVVVSAIGTAAIVTDTMNAGYYFGRVVAHVDVFLNPPPDRDTAQTVAATPRAPRAVAAAASPSDEPGASTDGAAAPAAPTTGAGGPDPSVAGALRSPGPPGSGSAAATARPTKTPKPTPAPTPVRKPLEVSIVPDPDGVFAHELHKDWCAVAGTQMVLSILGKADPSDAFQRRLAGRIGEWESRKDSRDGGWGPGAIALALTAYGIDDYEVRAYDTRADALLDAAIAISETHAPVVLLTWRGAHTWVMTGYRATADPLIFDDAKVTHAQILDPWYPWVSTIWGASSPPGFYEDLDELERNYLRWSRPEGSYPDRDGKFIAVVPTTVH